MVLFIIDKSGVIHFVFTVCLFLLLLSLHDSQRHDGLQSETLATLSPTRYCHCLIITFWKLQKTHNVAPVLLGLCFTLSTFYSPNQKLYAVGSPRLLEWLNPSLPSPRNHWFLLHLFHFKGERASHLPLHPHSLLQALRQPTEQRDRKWSRETRQLSTRLEPNPPTHTHTHICTDAPKPPGSPICFLTCHSQRCFSASLTTAYSPHFQHAGTSLKISFKSFGFHVRTYFQLRFISKIIWCWNVITSTCWPSCYKL